MTNVSEPSVRSPATLSLATTVPLVAGLKVMGISTDSPWASVAGTFVASTTKIASKPVSTLKVLR